MVRHSVSVLGAGNMGHGFAIQFAANDQDVTLMDHKESNLVEAESRIRDTVAFLNEEEIVSKSAEELLADVTFTTDVEAGVADADIVLETVPEDLEVKREVFPELAAAAPEDAILATNTSSIPITDIQEAVPDDADRVVGSHWWYPPYMLTPVEVIRGEQTTDESVERLAAFVEAVDRDPILVERDVPGFVWNRVQRAVYRECLYMVEEGIASIDDINRAIRDGYATRTAVIGPFETIDIAGLEQILAGTKRIQPTLCNDEEPSRLWDEYLQQGRGGIENGAGFLEWDRDPAEITADRDRKIAALRRALEETE